MRILTAEDIEDDDYDDTVIFCPACENRGYKNRIGPKILMPNEPRPDNYQDLWECPTCGLSGDASQIPKEETIKDAVETQDSPYESKTIVESVFRKRGPKKKIARHINKKIKHTDDPDIQREIKQHGENNVRVVYDSNP
jgi:hypothetical protein